MTSTYVEMSPWFTVAPKINSKNQCTKWTRLIWGALPLNKMPCWQKNMYLSCVLYSRLLPLTWSNDVEFILAAAPPAHFGPARALWGKILGNKMALRWLHFPCNNHPTFTNLLQCDPHSQNSTCNKDHTGEWNVKTNIHVFLRRARSQEYHHANEWLWRISLVDSSAWTVGRSLAWPNHAVESRETPNFGHMESVEHWSHWIDVLYNVCSRSPDSENPFPKRRQNAARPTLLLQACQNNEQSAKQQRRPMCPWET